jgi:transposase
MRRPTTQRSPYDGLQTGAGKAQKGRLAMGDAISVTTKRVCGLDLGDRSSAFCLCTWEGEVLEEGRVRTTAAGLARRFEAAEPMRIALEVGTHSPWISRLLRQWGHEVIVANARKVKLIGNSRRKNDRIDAQTLADLASVRPRLLHPVEHTSAEVQADRAVLRSRDALVRSRSGLISHVRGVAKALGERVPSCSAETFAKKAAESLSEGLVEALKPLLEILSELTAKIRDYDRQIQTLIRDRYAHVQRLTQVQGVGPITGLAFVLTLGDPTRFTKSRTVGAYLGLVPALRDSSQSEPQLRISKEGNPYLRRLLVQCAHYILGPFGQDSDLRRMGQRLTVNGGKNAKKKARVAVARKLSVLLHRLWVSAQVYEPLHSNGSVSAEPIAA